MPDIPQLPCIANMVKAMGDKLTPAQAKNLVDDLEKLTRKVAAEKQIPIADAAREVAEQTKKEERYLKAVAKRQAMLDLQARYRLKDAAMKGDKEWGKNIIKFLQKTQDQGNAIKGQITARFISELKAKGILDTWSNAENGRDFFIESWELGHAAAGLPSNVGRSGNKTALATAEIFREINLELNARANRHGATIEDVPGFVIKQSVSQEKLRRLGGGGAFNSKENKSAAFDAFRQFMDGLNIDWERTRYIDSKEDFIKAYFNNQYDKKFDFGADWKEDLSRFKSPGSLARRMSAARALWFKDAESAFKFNEAFGEADFSQAIMSTFNKSARNIALLQNLGTRPDDNLARVVKVLADDARKRDDSQKQLKALTGAGENPSKAITGMMDLLTGRANQASNALTHVVDAIKNLTYAAKGGGIIFSASTDLAFVQSRMAYEGFSALDKFTAQVDGVMKTRPEIAASIGVFNHSNALSVSNQYIENVKPFMGIHHIVQFMMKWQGLNAWTFNRQVSLGAAVSHYGLGRFKDVDWAQLPADRQRIFNQYDISPAEWNVIRKATEPMDGIDVIVPTSVRDLPDAEVGKLLDKKATTGAIARKRDELETKLSYYINDAISDGMNMPTASTRFILSGGGLHRGTIPREILELASIFKGFPIKAAMATMGRATNLAKAKGAASGYSHAFALIAETTVLGYLGMTAKDYLSGRTRRQLTDDKGNANWDVILASMARGGGLGIYTDILFSEYDRRYRSFLGQVAGPALSELETAAALVSKARSVAIGEEKPESLGLDTLKAFQANLPLINMFPIKPVMDNLLWWHIKEAISPGVMRKMERTLERENHQEFWVDDAFPELYR